MAKMILQNDEARKALKKGIDVVANLVKSTLGPRGRNVALDRSWGGPQITNDGVSIAKEVKLSDKFANMGVEIAKEVASKTNDKAGDGTTTSIVLFQAMVDDGLKRIALGVNPMQVREGIEQAAKDAEEMLKETAVKIKSLEETKQVATISAEARNLAKPSRRSWTKSARTASSRSRNRNRSASRRITWKAWNSTRATSRPT